jgi:hypothetical protein
VLEAVIPPHKFIVTLADHDSPRLFFLDKLLDPTLLRLDFSFLLLKILVHALSVFLDFGWFFGRLFPGRLHVIDLVDSFLEIGGCLPVLLHV